MGKQAGSSCFQKFYSNKPHACRNTIIGIKLPQGKHRLLPAIAAEEDV